MTVDGIKARIALFNQYDQAMAKLTEELDDFYKNSKILIGQESNAIKLYGLAFNFAWTLRNSIELCQKYEHEVKSSLLHERFKINQKLSDDFEQSVNEIVPQLENLSKTMNVTIDDNQRMEVITADDSDAEKLLSDNEYLKGLSKDLAANGNKILNIVCFYLRHISKQLINVKNVRANLTDNDYRFLFEREFKEYLSTDEWSNMKDSFIERTVKYKYHGIEPTKEQLYELRYAEIERITDMSDNFGAIESYLDDYPKLSRHIINREFETIINTPVLELFLHIGRKLIIDKWREQLEEEELCYVPEDDKESEVTYSEKYSEAICKKTMPKVLELYEGRDAMDWVCFYHVLVFYNYIGCDDFNVFNRWLTQVTGKKIISTGNARKIKMSYWAKDAKKHWTMEGALAETNTTQQETKFKNYTILCDDIRDIINNKAKRATS